MTNAANCRAAPGPAGEQRRGFLTKAVGTVLGAICGLLPLAAGLNFVLDPLWRRRHAAGFIRVTTLDALDDRPRVFTVIGTRVDAWNRSIGRLGAVYITRLPDRGSSAQLRVLQTICPHAGCFVNYESTTQRFACPCHESSFQLDGSKLAGSVAIRGLDELDWRVEGNDVLVEFKNFRSGPYAEKIPV